MLAAAVHGGGDACAGGGSLGVAGAAVAGLISDGRVEDSMAAYGILLQARHRRGGSGARAYSVSRLRQTVVNMVGRAADRRWRRDGGAV